MPPSNLEIPSWAATALSNQSRGPPPASQAAGETPLNQPTPGSEPRAQPATDNSSQSSSAAGARVRSVLPAVLALLEGCIGALAADVALAEALADGFAQEGSSLPVLDERCGWLCVGALLGHFIYVNEAVLAASGGRLQPWQRHWQTDGSALEGSSACP